MSDINLKVGLNTQAMHQGEAEALGVLDRLDRKMGQLTMTAKGIFAFDVVSAAATAYDKVKQIGTDIYDRGVKIKENEIDLAVSLKAQGVEWDTVKDGVESYLESMSKIKGVDVQSLENVLGGLIHAGYDLQDAYRQLPLVLDIAARGHMDLAKAGSVVESVFQGQFKVLRELHVTFTETGNKVNDVAAAFEALGKKTKSAHDQYIADDPAAAMDASFTNLENDLSKKISPTIVMEIRKLQGVVDDLDPDTLDDFADTVNKDIKIICGALDDFTAGAKRAADMYDRITKITTTNQDTGVPTADLDAEFSRLKKEKGGYVEPVGRNQDATDALIAQDIYKNMPGKFSADSFPPGSAADRAATRRARKFARIWEEMDADITEWQLEDQGPVTKAAPARVAEDQQKQVNDWDNLGNDWLKEKGRLDGDLAKNIAHANATALRDVMQAMPRPQINLHGQVGIDYSMVY